MKTIAQQLGIKDFSFRIKDKNGNIIYCEDSNCHWYKKEYDKNGNIIYREHSDGWWYKKEFDKNNNCIYCEYSDGTIEDNRPKESCNNKIITIEGKKYKLKELT